MTTDIKELFDRARASIDETHAALTGLMIHFEDEENDHDMATVEDRRGELETLRDDLFDAASYLSYAVERALADE